MQALAIGTIIPLASSIVPVNQALKLSLPDSLDNLKSKTKAIYVNILEKNKKDVGFLLISGSLSLSYGFGVYYLLPASLVSGNLSLAMAVFVGVLFGMILAMAVLTINMMPQVADVVSAVVLVFESYSTRLIVRKNLIAHRDRNRQTAMIFSLTLGFIIFLNIVAKIPFLKDQHEELKHKGHSNIKIGSDLRDLPLEELDEYLLKYEHMFEDVGLMSAALYDKQKDDGEPWGVQSVDAADVPRRRSDRVGVIGVSPSLIETLEPNYISYSQYDEQVTRLVNPTSAWGRLINYIYDAGGLTPGEQLYSAQGSQSAILSEYT